MIQTSVTALNGAGSYPAKPAMPRGLNSIATARAQRRDRQIELICDPRQHDRDVGGEGRHQKPARGRPFVIAAGAAGETRGLVRDQRMTALERDGALGAAFEAGLGPILADFRVVFDAKLFRHESVLLRGPWCTADR